MAIPIRLKNGTTFYVEAESIDSGGTAAADEDFKSTGSSLGATRSRGARLSELADLPAKAFGETVEVVEGIAEELSGGLLRQDNPMRPTELHLEVKVGFDAKGNVFLAAGHASASLKLNLKWQLKSPETPW